MYIYTHVNLNQQVFLFNNFVSSRPALVRDKSWATLRKQLHEFTINTQEELEAERAELLSKNAMLEQEVQGLQEYIDVHLAR